jgi:WD40 repeat protein
MSFWLWSCLCISGLSIGQSSNAIPAPAQKDEWTGTAVETYQFDAVFDILSLACSGADNLLAVASYDYKQKKGKIELWEKSTRRWSIAPKVYPHTRLVISPDGQTLLARLGGVREQQLQGFAVKSGKGLWSTGDGILFFPKLRGDVAFHPDGSFALYDGEDLLRGDRIQFRNPENGRMVRQIKSRAVQQMAFSRDGKSMATIGYDKKIQILDAKTGETKVSFEISFLPLPRSLFFTPEAKTLVIRDLANIEVRDAASGKLKININVPHSRFAMSPDGKWLAIALRAEKTVSVRDIRNGSEICSITTNDSTTDLAFPRNDMLVVAGARVVRVFEFSVKKK